MDWVKDFGWLLAIAANALMGLALFAMRNAFPARAEHDALATRVALAEQRLAQVPTHADLAELSGELAGIKAQLEPVVAGVRRIEDYLLKRVP